MHKQKHSVSKILFLGGVSTLLAACTPSAPQTLSSEYTIDYSYLVRDPISNEVVLSGVMQEQTFSPQTAEIFELFSGAKKDESRTLTTRDPLHQHDPSRVQKFPTLILNEMGIESGDGSTLMIDDQSYTLVDVISEDGVEKAVLDPNPLHTLQTMDWEFTLTQIK